MMNDQVLPARYVVRFALLTLLLVGASRTPAQAQIQWVTKNVTSQASRFNSTFFVSPTKGFVTGFRTLSYTTNSGDSWQAAKIPTAVGEIYSVHFPTPDVGYAVDGYGQIIKSVDGGLNWTLLVSGTTSRLNSVFFLDENSGFIVGGDQGAGQKGIILRTVDGGAKWTKIREDATSEYYCIWAFDTNNAFAGGVSGNRGAILKTTNGGGKWDAYQTNAPTFPSSMQFTSRDTGFIACGSGGMLKTYNGGATWMPLPTGHTQNLTSLYFADGSNGYVVAGTDGLIIKTSDRGSSWSLEYTKPNLSLASIKGAGGEVFAVGAGSMILKRTMVTSAAADEVTTGGRVRLAAAPNPTSGPCTITLELDRPSMVWLDVYSPLGDRVATLIPGEVRGAGVHQMLFEPEHAGTYLVRMVRNGVVTTEQISAFR